MRQLPLSWEKAIGRLEQPTAISVEAERVGSTLEPLGLGQPQAGGPQAPRHNLRGRRGAARLRVCIGRAGVGSTTREHRRGRLLMPRGGWPTVKGTWPTMLLSGEYLMSLLGFSRYV